VHIPGASVRLASLYAPLVCMILGKGAPCGAKATLLDPHLVPLGGVGYAATATPHAAPLDAQDTLQAPCMLCRHGVADGSKCRPPSPASQVWTRQPAQGHQHVLDLDAVHVVSDRIRPMSLAHVQQHSTSASVPPFSEKVDKHLPLLDNWLC
jgi:hypothetical protein